MSAERFLADTGFLVGLHSRSDPYHAPAIAWFQSLRGTLVTSEAVVTETAYFLPPSARAGFVATLDEGYMSVQELDPAGRRRVCELFTKYSNLSPDYADCSLVYLAETTGVERILTVDRRDFAVFRIGNRRRFELIDWF